MKALIHSWYKPQWWTSFLLPLAFIFYLIIRIRKLLYKFNILKTIKADVPVIVVGNITVGGAGKTPLVIWLVEYLKANGYQPGVVSRGYTLHRNKRGKQAVEVTTDSDPNQVGDEPLLIAARTHVPVVVCTNRVMAIQKLLANHRCNVIISDDGMQHYAMARDIEIAVLDGQRRLGNNFLLPAGPLREPAIRLKTVDFIVVNTGQPHQSEFQMRLKPDAIYNIQNPEIKKSMKDFIGQTLHAVAGVANPNRFFTLLRDNNLLIIKHPFPDHYPYKKADINFYGSINVIMTEKDAVKCKSLVDNRHWCLPVTAELDNVFGHKLLERLRSCSTKN